MISLNLVAVDDFESRKMARGTLDDGMNRGVEASV